MSPEEHQLKLLEMEISRAESFLLEASEKLAAAKHKQNANIDKAKADLAKAQAEVTRVEHEAFEDMANHRHLVRINQIWVDREKAALAAHNASNKSLGFNQP